MTGTTGGAAAVAFGILLHALSASAHHSISGVYDPSRSVQLEGTIAEFRFVHPHPFVSLEVEGADGAVEHWLLEMDNRFELARIGMTGDTFKPGDRIVVTGSPARREEQRLYIRRLEHPAGGFFYEQVGNSPRIRRSR